MSANRSVQAAQRRQTKTADPPMPGRGPQPSINSSQMFAAGQQQQRMGPGSGQVSGRLAGQNAALAQKQMMEQQSQQMNSQSGSSAALSSINKMTIPQAITLITLRLGKVETQLQNVVLGTNFGSNNENDDNILVDKNVIISLISRIDALEKRPVGAASSMPNSSTIGQDVSLLKQQFETIKPIVVQSKNSTTVLKQQLDGLKTELTETKELVNALQNLTMDNSNKILALNSVFNSENENDAFLDGSQEYDATDLLDGNHDLDNGGNEIIGTNLKELIESEFNSEA